MMTIQFANDMPELVAIRRHLHETPELGLSEFKTSDFIAGMLEKMGYEVTRGLATTGIVATLRHGTSKRSDRKSVGTGKSVSDGEISVGAVSFKKKNQKIKETITK